MRERGKLLPVISVAAVAFVVLVFIPLLLRRETHSRMATVEAQVSIGDLTVDSRRDRNAPTYRWPDSEVPRTAERLRDITAVSVAAVTYVAEGGLKNRPPSDVNEIVTGIAKRRLIPQEWLTNEAGVLKMPHGAVHLRYSRTTLTVEAVSVPNERGDGPAILIRIPDSENTGVGPRYFESMQLDGIVYPNPFAPIPEVIALGWQPRSFKQTQISGDERASLEQWIGTVARR
jgi:hypothetical protein